MLGGLFSGKPPEVRFWEWFQQHESEISAISTGAEPIVFEIGEQIRRVDPGLAWVTGTAADGSREFIVSAEGVKATIPIVEAVVAAAPEMPGWRIVAFRPRQKSIVGLQFQDRSLSAESIFYISRPTKDKLDVDLFIEGLDASNAPDLIQACFLLLDATIGEYDVMTRIGELDFIPLSESQGGHKPLSALPAEVDALKGSAS